MQGKEELSQVSQRTQIKDKCFKEMEGRRYGEIMITCETGDRGRAIKK